MKVLWVEDHARAGELLTAAAAAASRKRYGIDLVVAARSAGRAGSVGEPWTCRMRPNETLRQLTNLGFSNVFHLTPDLAQARYFSGRKDSLRAPKWEHLLTATV